MILSFAFLTIIYNLKSNLLHRILQDSLRIAKRASYDLYDTYKNFFTYSNTGRIKEACHIFCFGVNKVSVTQHYTFRANN